MLCRICNVTARKSVKNLPKLKLGKKSAKLPALSRAAGDLGVVTSFEMF